MLVMVYTIKNIIIGKDDYGQRIFKVHFISSNRKN